jgi:hypothetical protein
MSKKLFRLIKSLTPTEKAHFKKISGHNTEGVKIYITLFDVLEKMKEYDFSAIKLNFKKHQTRDDIAVYLDYLFGNIMDSLRIYHSRKTIDSKIKYLIRDAELLYAKDLYPEAMKTLGKAKQKARVHEMFLLLIEITGLELQMAGNQIDLKLIEKIIKEGHVEQRDLMNKLKISRQYRELYTRVFYLAKRIGVYIKNRKELNKLEMMMKDPLLLSEKQVPSLSARDMYYTMHSTYNSIKLQPDIPKSILYTRKRKELMENNIHWSSQRLDVYITILYNLSLRYGATYELKKFDGVLEDLKNIPERFNIKLSKNDEKRIIENIKNLFIYRCILLGEFEKGINTIKGKEVEWEELGAKFSTENILLLYSNMYELYFGISDFKKALHWNNKIINTPYITIPANIHIRAMTRNIIIHYELGHFEQVEPLIKASRRFLDKEQMTYPFQQFFLENIQKVVDANYKNKEDIRNAFLLFKKELIAFKNKTHQMLELEYNTYMAWIDTHIEEKKFAETYKKYVKIN